jgi:hypothetical protein
VNPRRCCALLAAAAAIACAENGASSTTTVRDSAGVEIVESGATGAWTAATAWTVADTPSLSIGGNDTDSTAIFSRIRSVTRLGDGRIVVANAGTYQLRFYDSTGHFIKAAGRPGKGPGEFNWLGPALRIDGDSLILWDPNNGRLSVFDSGGRLVRAVPLRSGQGVSFPDPVGYTSDGSLIGRISTRNSNVGAIRSPSLFVRYGADLVPIDTIAERPGDERFVQPCGQGMCGYDPPFARSTVAAFARDRLYVGSGDRYEISVFGLDGREIKSIRTLAANRSVTRTEVARQRDEFLALARNEQARQQLERVYLELTVPETMPAYKDLRLDRVGNLWVEDYRPTDDEVPQWTVFDSTGRLLGAVDAPRSLRIDDIGDDYLLGVFRDSLDVEHVRMHRITKPRGR